MKYFFSFCILLSAVCFSQSSKFYTMEEIAKMAIYPGCENHKDFISAPDLRAKNLALKQCFAESFYPLFKTNLNEEKIKNYLAQNNLNYLFDSFSFIITKEGRITQIKSEYNQNEFFSEEVINALEKTAKQLKNTPIEPAKLEDGSSAELFYTLPLRRVHNKD